MTISEGFTIQELIQDQFIGNPNFPAFNFTSTSAQDYGTISSIGYFYANGTDIAFDEGLVLSTGNVLNVPGENTTNLMDGTTGWIGDDDLETFTATTDTYNATSIEFDFIATVPMISLDFILASEEYGFYECNFGDTFAFLLTDSSTGVTTNIALVPGTTTPISILNVRGGDNSNCNAVNEDYFHRYNYTVADANIPSIPAEDSPINFNGETTVFMLVEDLVIGHTYHLKIVTADHLDAAFDSALFIRNSSFGAFPTIINEPENIIINDEDDDGTETFDLTMFEDQMLGDTIDTTVYSFDFTYHLSLADAKSGVNAIANPEAYTNTADLQEIHVRMQNSYTGTGITTSFRITIDAELLSTPDFQSDDFIIYPNPVVDKLTIDTSKVAFETIQVFNMNGQLIQTKTETTNGFVTIDFSNLESGVYFLNINTSKGKVYKRVVK